MKSFRQYLAENMDAYAQKAEAAEGMIASAVEEIYDSFDMPYDQDDHHYYHSVYRVPAIGLATSWMIGDDETEISISINDNTFWNKEGTLDQMLSYLQRDNSRDFERALRTAAVEAHKIAGKRFKLSPTDRQQNSMN